MYIVQAIYTVQAYGWHLTVPVYDSSWRIMPRQARKCHCLIREIAV